jgi:hypothetical protein
MFFLKKFSYPQCEKFLEILLLPNNVHGNFVYSRSLKVLKFQKIRIVNAEAKK